MGRLIGGTAPSIRANNRFGLCERDIKIGRWRRRGRIAGWMMPCRIVRRIVRIFAPFCFPVTSGRIRRRLFPWCFDRFWILCLSCFSLLYYERRDHLASARLYLRASPRKTASAFVVFARFLLRTSYVRFSQLGNKAQKIPQRYIFALWCGWRESNSRLILGKDI